VTSKLPYRLARRRTRLGASAPEVAAVAAALTVAFVAALPQLEEARQRTKRSDAVTEMRRLGVALESYFVDNAAYPQSNSLGFAGQSPDVAQNANPARNAVLERLSTPVAYINTPFIADPFTTTRRSGAVNSAAGTFNATNLGSGASPFWNRLRYYAVSPAGLADVTTAFPASMYILTSSAEDGVAMELDNLLLPASTQAAIVRNIYAPNNGTPPIGSIYRIGGTSPGTPGTDHGARFFDLVSARGGYISDDPNPPDRLRVAGHIIGAMGETIYEMNADWLMDSADLADIEELETIYF
jgi:hypothetical protein